MSFCPVCNQKVFASEAVRISSKSYHGRCCKCNYKYCCTRLSAANFYVHQNQLFCKNHVLLAEKHPEMVRPIPESTKVQETRFVLTRGNTPRKIPEPEPPKTITFGKEYFIQREQERLQKIELQKREKQRQEQEKKDWLEKKWLCNATMETHTDVLVIVFSMLGLSPALCWCACTCKRWYNLITMKDGAYEVWYKKYLGPERRIDWNWSDVIHHVKANKTLHLSNLMRWYSGPEIAWNVTQETLIWIVEGGFEKALDYILNVWLPLVQNKRRTINFLFGLDSWHPSCNIMYWAMKSRNTRMMDLLLQHGAEFSQCTSVDQFNLELLEDHHLLTWILSKTVLAKKIFLEILNRGDIKQIKKIEALGFPLVLEPGPNLWSLALGNEMNDQHLPETEQEELREWLFEKKLERFISIETILKLVMKNDIPTLRRLIQGGVNLNMFSISRILTHSRMNFHRALEQDCPLDLFTFLVTEGGVKVTLFNFFEPNAVCVLPTATPKLQILRKTGDYSLQGSEVSQAIHSGCKIEIIKELVLFPGFTPSADLLKPFHGVSPMVVEVFLKAGMNINQFVEGRNMLQWALGNKDKVLATFLLKQNIDVNPVTVGMPPLALAIMMDVVGMSALLIKAGADVMVSAKALAEVDVKQAQKLRDIATRLGK